MEKHITRWSFWLGLACTVVAVVLRGLHAAGLAKPSAMVQDGWHMVFYKGALLLFLTAVASAASAWSQAQK